MKRHTRKRRIRRGFDIMDPFAGGRGMGMDFSPPRQRGGGFGLFDMPRGGGFGGGLMDPMAPQRPPRRFRRRRPSSAYRHPKPKPYRVRPRYPMPRQREPEERHERKGVNWGELAGRVAKGAGGFVGKTRETYTKTKAEWDRKRKEALQERIDKGGIGALTKKEKQELLNSKETEIV